MLDSMALKGVAETPHILVDLLGLLPPFPIFVWSQTPASGMVPPEFRVGLSPWVKGVGRPWKEE